MRIGRREFTGAALVSAGALISSAAGQEKDKSGGKPEDIALRGRVVCVTEEFQRLYQTAADCDRRGHVYALQTADGGLYPFLPTDSAAAIYTDERFRARELQVTARLFPSLRIIEVIKLQAWQQGKLHNLFYFCEVCNIRTHKPGACDCCQDPVQFKEVLVTADDEP